MIGPRESRLHRDSISHIQQQIPARVDLPEIGAAKFASSQVELNLGTLFPHSIQRLRPTNASNDLIQLEGIRIGRSCKRVVG